MKVPFLLCCLALLGGWGCAPRRAAPADESASFTPAPAPAGPSTAPLVATQPPAREVAEPPAREGVNPPTGRSCKVHFRRDALGLSAVAPLGIGQGEVPGRVTHMAGTIDQVTVEWVVLASDGKQWWIPRSAILAIELPPER